MSNALKTATAVVGLLAGVVASLYVLGGLVIALRMLFDSFSLNEIVAILGQLPRELVVTTAMLDVLMPAAAIGLVVGLVAAIWADLHGITLPGRDAAVGAGGYALMLLATLVLVAPALGHALATDGPTLSLASSVLGVLATLLVAYAGWYGLRAVAGSSWDPGPKLLAAGGIVAAIAVIPMVMYAASLAFPQAQACVSDSPVAVQGLLVGEGGGRVLLEQHEGHEAGIIALPSDHVTKTEYGDLATSFVCPLPAGQEAPPAVAEAALEGHGSEREVQLATELRPRLLFDTREHWRPIEVGSFAGESFVDGKGHEACWLGPERCEPLEGLAQLVPGPRAPAYLDLHGSGEDGSNYASPQRRCHAGLVVDCNEGPRAVIYYRRTSHGGLWYWDYWWFLRYNEYTGPFRNCNAVICSNHEGDWEGMTVVTTPSLEPQIVKAIYAAHRNRILVEGSQLPLENGHPVVFVAEGTHAGYPYRCPAGCRQYEKKAGVRLPEDPHDGTAPWGGNDDSDCARFECVRPFPEVGKPSDLALPRAGAWAGWRGQWGVTCSHGCASPLEQGSPHSPGTQVRFQCPWVATDKALPATDGSGLSLSQPLGDTERQLAECAAQRGGL
jgi:hypothetical protein